MSKSSPRVFEASGGVWAQLRVEAMQAAAEEPLLASYLHASILHHDRIEDALSYHLAQKLGTAISGAAIARSDPRRLHGRFATRAASRARHARRARARSRVPHLSAAVPLFQRLWRPAGLPHRPLALGPAARDPRLSFAEPRLGIVRGRHSSGRARSAPASSSTTRTASSSAKPRWWRMTCPCCTR